MGITNLTSGRAMIYLGVTFMVGGISLVALQAVSAHREADRLYAGFSEDTPVIVAPSDLIKLPRGGPESVIFHVKSIDLPIIAQNELGEVVGISVDTAKFEMSIPGFPTVVLSRIEIMIAD